MLADASRIRASAAADADALLVDAQIMADRLQSESLAEYERLVREATERSDGILARARVEADRLRSEAQAQAEAIRLRAESEIDQVRAQVREELREEQRATLGHARLRSDDLLRDLESNVLGLGTTFERANASVADVVATIGRLRSVTESALPVVTTTAAPAAPASTGAEAATAGTATAVLDLEPAVEPVVEPVPEPVAEPAPEAVAEPAPEAVQPEPEPAPEPVAEQPADQHSDHGNDQHGEGDNQAGSTVSTAGSPMISRVSTADTPRGEASEAAIPVPATDENATSFLGTDPPRPVTDWTTGADEAGAAPVVATGTGDSRPLGWLFRATS